MICKANRWTGFYNIETSVTKDLNLISVFVMQLTPFGLLQPEVLFQIWLISVFIRMDMDLELRISISSLFHSRMVEEKNEFSKTIFQFK